MIVNSSFSEMINSPVRSFRGRVEIYEGSTLTLICGCHDRLKSFSIERVGENSKFFGFGVCQKITVNLLDKDRELTITEANSIEVEFGKDNDYLYPYPRFHVKEVSRDEKTNELTIVAYDTLIDASKYKVSDLKLAKGYTIAEFATACSSLLGLPISIPNISVFNTLYEAGANFSGEENIRDALDSVAEATQTIYYINWDWQLTFKRLNYKADAVLTIDKEKYFTLDGGSNPNLIAVCHATELGDNVIASAGGEGVTQYVRDNPFWDLRDDIGQIVRDALAAVNGMTINQFNCSWRGNFLLEIGDKVALVTKDGDILESFVFDDVITFNGALSEVTQWTYSGNEAETADNPATLGEALSQTFARVDKANRQIELLASETSNNSENIASLVITTDSINQTVRANKKSTDERLSQNNERLNTLETQVKQDAESFNIFVREIEDNGVSKITTETGFRFDNEGLLVSKSGQPMTTQITENGMIVYRSGDAMLTANEEGVKAKNLHANTWLLIGDNSRFEDYIRDGEQRTGCFWIGG